MLVDAGVTEGADVNSQNFHKDNLIGFFKID
jgi:hypothetical protein